MIKFRQKKINLLPDRYIETSERFPEFTYAEIPGILLQSAKKTWKATPGNSNKALIISVQGHPEYGYFELIKDKEPRMYACHFKTETGKGFGHEKGFSHQPLPEKYKELLFRSLIDNLPEGSFLSTWGSLSPGGFHALQVLGKRSNGKLEKSGERKVTMATGEWVKIPIWRKT